MADRNGKWAVIEHQHGVHPDRIVQRFRTESAAINWLRRAARNGRGNLSVAYIG